MEGLQGMTPVQQQDFLQHLERQQVRVREIECAVPQVGRLSVGSAVSHTTRPAYGKQPAREETWKHR